MQMIYDLYLQSNLENLKYPNPLPLTLPFPILFYFELSCGSFLFCKNWSISSFHRVCCYLLFLCLCERYQKVAWYAHLIFGSLAMCPAHPNFWYLINVITSFSFGNETFNFIIENLSFFFLFAMNLIIAFEVL